MNKIILIGISAHLLISSVVASIVYDPANGHSYELIVSATPLTWENANAQAKTLYFNGKQGYLTSISSQAENDFIYNNLLEPSAAFHIQGRALIGGLIVGGHWTWSNGEAWSFLNWGNNQPDNYLGNENYLEMVGQGVWNDRANDGHTTWFANVAVVEYSVVPEPSTYLVGALMVLPVGCQGIRYLRKRMSV